MDIPTGMMPCPDPDCEFPGECFGKPEDYSEDLTEPEVCEACGSTDDMTWKQEDKAWYCSDCGHAHVAAAAIQGLGEDGKF